MGANHSHPLRRSSTRPSSTRPSPATTYSFPTSTPSTSHGTPRHAYVLPSPTFSLSPDESTSISCEPSTSLKSPREQPLRIGYPYYDEVALEAKRGSRRRSRSLSKVLEGIGFSGSGSGH